MRQQAGYATLLFVFFSFSLFANHVDDYINNYKDIAQREMKRSDIPASIILAQGIHESSWGQGELAVESKNHFGIKCKDYWQGPTYYIEDDDFENGRLVKSCFRAYDDVEDSYIDHTDFLVDNDRYAILFDFDKTDYVNWAKGLKKCGYATDPKYASKLIRIIETHQLHRFDNIADPVMDAPVFYIAPNFLQPDSPVDPVIYTYEESSTLDTYTVYEENSIEQGSGFNYEVPIDEMPNEEEPENVDQNVIFTPYEDIRISRTETYEKNDLQIITNNSSNDKRMQNLTRKPRSSGDAGPR